MRSRLRVVCSLSSFSSRCFVVVINNNDDDVGSALTTENTKLATSSNSLFLVKPPITTVVSLPFRTKTYALRIRMQHNCSIANLDQISSKMCMVQGAL